MHPLKPGQNICPFCGNDCTHTQNPENTLPEGTILSGKYLIGKILGQGGFGITYLGVDLALNIRVAVKEFFPVGVAIRTPQSIQVTTINSDEISAGFQKGCEEFQAEAMRLARFNSPNIVHVRDYFRENGTAYIVMDFVEGNILSKEVRECGGRIPWKRVITLFVPLMQQLDQIHREHLIHRDIKPDNIKVVKEGGNGREHLVLLDFGAARGFISAEVTKTYTAVVTPGYAPIEQYSMKSRQGPFTDVYALCATMYALIAGRIPASATDRVTRTEEIPLFSQLGISVPESIERALFHGLALQANNRTQTMLDLYNEISGTAGQKMSGGYGNSMPDPRSQTKVSNNGYMQGAGQRNVYQNQRGNSDSTAGQKVSDTQQKNTGDENVTKASISGKKKILIGVLIFVIVLILLFVFVLYVDRNRLWCDYFPFLWGAEVCGNYVR